MEAYDEVRRRMDKRNRAVSQPKQPLPIDITGPRGQRLRLTIQESVRLREQLLEAELKLIVR